MQCIIMEKHLIKLTYHDETKKRAHDSQIVSAKENLKLSLMISAFEKEKSLKSSFLNTCTVENKPVILTSFVYNLPG